MPASKSFARNTADQQRLALVVLGGNVESPVHVRAHYNPHEVSFERAATWNEQPQKGADPHLEYTKANSRTMSLELMFDCAEMTGQTLAEDLETLQTLMKVEDPEGTEAQRKPPLLEVINGPLPNFRCVIESLAVKVTMFSRQMEPVRATVSIKLKEVRGPEGMKCKNPTSIPRENFLAWTESELRSRVGEAYRSQDWRSAEHREAEAKRAADERYASVLRDVGELE